MDGQALWNTTTEVFTNFEVNAFATFEEKVFYCIVGGIGFLGNLFVIFVFLKTEKFRHKVSNMLIINQSIIDMLAALFFGLNKVFDGMRWISKPGLLASFFCSFWLSEYLPWMFMAVSTFNLEAITIERYIALIHPMFYKKHITRRVIWGVIPLVWLVSFTHESYEIGSSRLSGSMCSLWTHWPSKQFHAMFGIYIFLVEFIMPIFIMTFCYSRIVHMIHNGSKSQIGSTQREIQMSKSRNIIIRTLILVSMGFFICWGPSHIFSILKRLHIVEGFTGTVYQITSYLAVTNCSINPIIYSFSHTLFRTAIKKIFSYNKNGIKSGLESTFWSQKTEENETGLQMSENVQI